MLGSKKLVVKSPGGVFFFCLTAKLLMRKAGHADFIALGHVPIEIQYQLDTKKIGLLLYNEPHKESTFYELLPVNTYKRPRGNIIEWWQPTSGADYLLIFYEEICCSYIWGMISRMQRDWHLNNHEDVTSPIGPLYPGSSDLRELPSVDLSGLPLLLKIILGCKFSDQRHIAKLLEQDNEFVPKLMALFQSCEDSNNIDGLHMIYRLVRGIILLSDIGVYDRLFSGKFLMGVVGALEYNPEEPKAQSHRSLVEMAVNEHVIFKEALPVKDHSLSRKLYKSYGIDYIKDVILVGTLDKVTIDGLTMYVRAINFMLFCMLKGDSCFMRELLAKLKSYGISPDSQRDLVLLLCELWSFSEAIGSKQISDFWWGIIDGETYNITVTVMQTIISQNVCFPLFCVYLCDICVISVV
ncbi:Serine/threonine-protein phosphatase 4 regulatory subunit 3 [Rhynchospora pubera]|uniref:Serine/threonine-protein phosphatase 4 regulatory subunit 3 n=1 Tax=Rhynchospora pubera TaxID=906938 RepID=A0AAV8F346_9POAL|nr:Serine/threonine-protein phosphatase 4 regulatory subunit 3 [Rhynchospora pubera]